MKQTLIGLMFFIGSFSANAYVVTTTGSGECSKVNVLLPPLSAASCAKNEAKNAASENCSSKGGHVQSSAATASCNTALTSEGYERYCLAHATADCEIN